jgi:hypothetical protein
VPEVHAVASAARLPLASQAFSPVPTHAPKLFEQTVSPQTAFDGLVAGAKHDLPTPQVVTTDQVPFASQVTRPVVLEHFEAPGTHAVPQLASVPDMVTLLFVDALAPGMHVEGSGQSDDTSL